jgi:hypothetical protein
MFRSKSSDYHQGSITVLVQLLSACVHRRIPVCGCMLSVKYKCVYYSLQIIEIWTINRYISRLCGLPVRLYIQYTT